MALDSANRIHETVQRMRRVTNLDRAEIMPVDLNELLEDVGSTIKTGAQDPVRLSSEFQPLPKLTLRPQQIGSALSYLLHYAVDARTEYLRTTAWNGPSRAECNSRWSFGRLGAWLAS